MKFELIMSFTSRDSNGGQQFAGFQQFISASINITKRLNERNWTELDIPCTKDTKIQRLEHQKQIISIVISTETHHWPSKNLMYLNNIYLRNNGRMYKIDTGNSSKEIPQSQKKKKRKKKPQFYWLDPIYSTTCHSKTQVWFLSSLCSFGQLSGVEKVPSRLQKKKLQKRLARTPSNPIFQPIESTRDPHPHDNASMLKIGH